MSFKAPSDALNVKKLSKYPHALNPLDISRSHQMSLSFPKALDKITGLNSVLSIHTCLLRLRSMQFFGRPPKWFDWKPFTPQNPIRLFFPTHFSNANTFLSHSCMNVEHGSIFLNLTPWCSQTRSLMKSQNLLMIKGSTAGGESLNWPYVIVFWIEHIFQCLFIKSRMY